MGCGADGVGLPPRLVSGLVYPFSLNWRSSTGHGPQASKGRDELPALDAEVERGLSKRIVSIAKVSVREPVAENL
jgi:hypothetical protein